MKKEEWGLVTVAALLSTLIFPPYFLPILAISGLTSLAYGLKKPEEEDQLRRLLEFEQEFRVGYDHEERREFTSAADVYRRLAEKYRSAPKIQEIALRRIEFVEEQAQQSAR